MTDPFDDLDRETVTRIGDAIVYQPGGGAALNPPITAWVDHSDMDIGFGGVSAVAGDASLQVRKIDVVAPVKTDIITLPRTGQSYRPTEIKQDKSGRYWFIMLKLVPL